MSLAWLLPAAFAALLALAIPLLIHLARREQQQPTVFAALRWLRERPKPRRRLRFDEWPLLLLRLLLLALLASWLARPVLTGAPDTTPWTVVAPGVPETEVAQLLDAGEGERRWLAEGFPPLSTPMPQGAQATASLLRQLDAEVPQGARLSVRVPERLAGLDGTPLLLSRQVDWQVSPGQSPLPDARPEASPRLVVRHADGRHDGVRVLRAATLALHPDMASDAVFEAAPAGTPWPDTAQRIAWLAPGAMPAELRAWIEAGGVALFSADVETDAFDDRGVTLWRDVDGSPLLDAAVLGAGRVLQLRKPLHPAAMPQVLEPGFPRQLAALFEVPVAPTRALASEVVPGQGVPAWPIPHRELQPWLALLVALLWLIERWLATSSRRKVRA